MPYEEAGNAEDGYDSVTASHLCHVHILSAYIAHEAEETEQRTTETEIQSIQRRSRRRDTEAAA